jgi:hypothetical protein
MPSIKRPFAHAVSYDDVLRIQVRHKERCMTLDILITPEMATASSDE